MPRKPVLNRSLRKLLLWGLAGLSGVAVNLGSDRAMAIDQNALLLLTDVPDPYTLAEANNLPANVVLPSTISQTNLTVPSLWWTRDQFGTKLLETWFAFPSDSGIPPRVDLVVNQQVWSLNSYLERYTFLNQFGMAGHDFGYSTRIFNRQRRLLAAYICDPAIPASDGNSAQSGCNVFLESSGQGSLQGGSNFLDGLQSGSGAVQP